MRYRRAFVRRYCVLPGVSSQTSGRLPPASGPHSLLLLPCLMWLFGRGAIGPQLIDRDLGKPLRQRLEVSCHVRKCCRSFVAPLVHIECAVDLELDRMQADRRISIVLGDEAPGIWLVAADHIAQATQRRLDGLYYNHCAARPIAV